MEKVQPYDAAAAAAHHAARGPPIMAIDTMHELVFEMRDEKQATPRGTSRKANKEPKSERRRFRSKCI